MKIRNDVINNVDFVVTNSIKVSKEVEVQLLLPHNFPFHEIKRSGFNEID